MISHVKNLHVIYLSSSFASDTCEALAGTQVVSHNLGHMARSVSEFQASDLEPISQDLFNTAFGCAGPQDLTAAWIFH